MTTAGTQFSLVLLGRFAGKDKPVAAALARDFGCDETWGMQILGAAPIILLDGLSAEQAQAIHEALADVEAAGSKIETRPGTDPELSKVGWAAPPRIKGRLVAEYAGGSGATATLLVPCPYTGQKIKLTISISAERVVEQAVLGAEATAPAGPIPISAPPIPVPVPSPSLARSVSGSGSALAANRRTPSAPPAPNRLIPGTGAKVAPPEPAGAPIERGLEALDELHPLVEASPLSGGHAPSPLGAEGGWSAQGPSPTSVPPDSQALRPARIQSGTSAAVPQPLPDIPVLHGTPAHALQPVAADAAGNPLQAPMPQDLLSTPMELSAFEANVSASGILKSPVQQAAPQQITPQRGTPEALPADDGSLWSVLMGKSANPKVHEAVAELQGMSIADAAKLCQKPVVTLAKDISGAEARGLKQQFAALNVSLRLTRRGN